MRKLTRDRFWIACVAGLALLLQAFASVSLASAASFAPDLDAFGNVLCITSHEVSPSGSDNSDPSKLKCCTLGCSFGVQTLDTASGHFLLVGNSVSSTAAVAPPAGPTAHVRRDYDPGNPRAPPAA